MTDAIHTHTFDNGLVLLAQPMAWLESAAFTFLLPAGCARDPSDRLGLANFACEMAQRGCGERDSRQFVEALERLGAARSASVAAAHTGYGAAALSENLLPALELYADLILRPHVPEAQMEDGRQVCFQELRSIEDDLAQRTMQQLRVKRYGDPWGRASTGTREAVEAIAHDDITAFLAKTYRPQGTILSIAGKFDWPKVRDHIGELFADWRGAPPEPAVDTRGESGYEHIAHESQQTHVSLAYASVPYCHDDYYQSRGAVGILSGGSSARLFTEIRERRGLCYTVYATLDSLKDRGSVVCYAGTSAERAQETLDVLLEELHKLPRSIEQSELDRLKARVKTSLIMQQESSPSRTLSLATDWYHLGRVKTLAEVGTAIDGLTCESIRGYLQKNPPGDFTIVTLGQKPLTCKM